jgi:hypothetical protein
VEVETRDSFRTGDPAAYMSLEFVALPATDRATARRRRPARRHRSCRHRTERSELASTHARWDDRRASGQLGCSLRHRCRSSGAWGVRPRRSLWTRNRSAAWADPLHPVRRHDLYACELPFGGSLSTVAVAMRQKQQCRRSTVIRTVALLLPPQSSSRRGCLIDCRFSSAAVVSSAPIQTTATRRLRKRRPEGNPARLGSARPCCAYARRRDMTG